MQMFIIRGLPGSGKSTTARNILGGLPKPSGWFEADHFFENEDGDYVFDRTKLRDAHAWCKEQVQACLEIEQSVIVSNTFTTKVEMRPYFQIAQKFEITPQVILCQGDWGSIHSVPQETMDAMRKRFEYDITQLYKDYT